MLAQEWQRPRASITAFSTLKPAFDAIFETEKLGLIASSSETKSQFLQIMNAGE